MLTLKKGVNLGGFLSQCSEYTTSHYETFITENDIVNIADLNFDHVRLPIDYEVIENEDGSEIRENYHFIDDTLSWCKKRGLKVILDVHKTWGYFFDDAGVEGRNTLFDSPQAQDRFVSLWDRLSARYEKYHDFVAYELLNEVVNPEYCKPWNELIKRTVSVIRKNAPDTTIVYGGVEWNSAGTLKLLEDPADDNTIFTFHYYEPLLFTHQKAPWVPTISQQLKVHYPDDMAWYKKESEKIGLQGMPCVNCEADSMGVDFHEKMIKSALDVKKEKNITLYCGEFGVIDRADEDDAIRWYRDILNLFEKYDIGYALWSYKEMDFGIMGEKYERLRAFLKQA